MLCAGRQRRHQGYWIPSGCRCRLDPASAWSAPAYRERFAFRTRTITLVAVLENFIRQLGALESLTAEQVAVAVDQLIDHGISAEAKAEFLVALARKGETVEEISAFAQALRRKAVEPPLPTAWREAHEIL